jgi:hypothetical protein
VRERMAVRERVAVRKWYGIVLQNCLARWSAVESVQKTAPRVAVFCHLTTGISILAVRRHRKQNWRSRRDGAESEKRQTYLTDCSSPR